MAATLLTLPPADLIALSPGLWLLVPARDAATSAARERLLAWLDALGGVRLCAALLAAAADPAGIIALARERRSSIRQQPRWGMVYETHYPAAEMWVVPLTRVHAAPQLLIGLHAALGSDGFDAEWCGIGGGGDDGESPSDIDPLVVLHCKYGLLLMRERSLNRGTPRPGDDAATTAVPTARPVAQAAAPEAADGENADEAALLASATPAELARWQLPAWLTPWSCRTFSFSAALDPLIAVAALNIGAIAHYRYGAAAEAEARCTAARAALAAARSEIDAARYRVGRAVGAEARLAPEWRWIASMPGLQKAEVASAQQAAAQAALAAAEEEMAAASVALEAAASEAAKAVIAAADLSAGTGSSYANSHSSGLPQGLCHGPLSGLRVYDPCVGSGTVLAAAAQLGARLVVGSDLSAKNVEGAKRNLSSLLGRLEGNGGEAGGDAHPPLDLFEHDATKPLPPEKCHLLPCSAAPTAEAHTPPSSRSVHGVDLVVTNPPWGKNIGTAEDGAPIVQSVVEQFQGGECAHPPSRLLQPANHASPPPPPTRALFTSHASLVHLPREPSTPPTRAFFTSLASLPYISVPLLCLLPQRLWSSSSIVPRARRSRSWRVQAAA